METRQLRLDTSHGHVHDLTKDVESFCRGKGDGLVLVFAPHATAGLALMETGSGSDNDLVALLRELLPRDDRYLHRHGSQGHGADHLVPVLISPSLVLPVDDGRLTIGTWQSVVLVDLNDDNPHRTVRLSFIAG
jgi:secondary thiamine-phosphate synthase enzyme